jgi:FkbM family methyltransferase
MGGWEKATIRYLNESVKEGHVVIEVGANVGSHTLFMARNVGQSGRVYAFEPTDYAAGKLQANLRLNSEIVNVVLRREMVTNSDGDLPNLSIKSTWMLDGKYVDPCNLESPRSISLDRFVSEEGIDRIDLIKIDVDGYDYKVLEGAKSIINRFKPIIFCELYEKGLREQGDSIDKIFVLLGSLGYEAYADDGTSLLGGAEDVIRITGYDGSVNGVFLQKRD